MLYDVWVYVFNVDKDYNPTQDVHYEYVSASKADHGEIIAALQVLYPNYAGCEIKPFVKNGEE